MQEQKNQDQLLGFRSQLDPSRQRALIQKLMSDQTDMATQRLAQAILESFSKSEVLDSERERAQKIAQEISPQGNTSEDKKDFTNKKMLNEEKKVERQPFKPKSVVAIDERELNKVELAYFKRPLDVVILSDKDASRLLKGQDVPHLHGQKRILQTYGVQLNGAITSYNYDGDSGQENETKAQNAKNQALEYDAEVASNMSQSESEPPYNGNGPHATPLNSIRKSTNNHHGPSTFQRRGGIGQNIKGLSNKIKTNKGRVLPMRRSHNMSEAGSQDDERSVKDGDSDSVEIVSNHGHKQFSEMNKKLYCICQQEYKHGNLMFQCEGPCEGWYHPQCVKMPEERVQHLKNSNDPWICDFCLNYANGQADLNNQISSGKLTACELVDSASKHKKKRDIKAASKTLGGQLNLSQGNSKESSKDIGPSSSVQGNNNGQISNNQSQ